MAEGREEGDRVPLREEGRAESIGLGGREFVWPTVDGSLGVIQRDEALKLARSFFLGGFCLLPWLWFVNCFYFFPVLRGRQTSDPLTRFYVVGSGIGCIIVTVLLLAWSLLFAIGGESVLGDSWNHLAVYNLADKYSTAWTQ